MNTNIVQTARLVQSFAMKLHAWSILALIGAAICLPQAPLWAQAVIFDAPMQPAQSNLVIYSTLDTPRAGTLIAAFQAQNPTVSVTYEDMLAADIAARVIRENDAGAPTADFVFSSGMDLQMKLANDGYGQPVATPTAPFWPAWAKWQDIAFALTYEPAVLVYHRPSFPNGPPQSRLELMDWLRAQPRAALGSGPIGTYDIAASSVGYLHLARDAEHFADIWSLVRTMGAAGAQVFPTSQDIISRVADGRLALGYNILGSYAAEQARANPDLGVVLLRDFTVVVSRIGLVPRASRNPDLGAAFLAFLMGVDGQSLMANQLSLPAISPEVTTAASARSLQAQLGPQLRPVAVGPGLMVYLDQGNRRRMLALWGRALGLPDAP
ncbi:MAG: ABC transporter substrate-binding protein [Cypionkella sp.]|nr:ABC transporter substrate-binding protein [Cypionkella sp.]